MEFLVAFFGKPRRRLKPSQKPRGRVRDRNGKRKRDREIPEREEGNGAGPNSQTSCRQEAFQKDTQARQKRLCVIAGNISPIDVITHVPVLCEEAEIPYIYVPSKEDLATAGAMKKPTCCVLVLTKPAKGEIGQEEQEKLKADYTQVVSDVNELTSCLF